MTPIDMPSRSTGTRRRHRRGPLGIVLIPVAALRCGRIHGFVPGGVFWDLFGSADYVVGVRPVAAGAREAT